MPVTDPGTAPLRIYMPIPDPGTDSLYYSCADAAIPPRPGPAPDPPLQKISPGVFTGAPGAPKTPRIFFRGGSTGRRKVLVFAPDPIRAEKRGNRRWAPQPRPMYVGVFFFLQAPAYEAIAAGASSPRPWPGTALVYINTASTFQQRQLFSTYFATHEVQEWDATVAKYLIDDSGVACSSDYSCASNVHRNVCPKCDIPSPPSPAIGLPMHMRRQ